MTIRHFIIWKSFTGHATCLVSLTNRRPLEGERKEEEEYYNNNDGEGREDGLGNMNKTLELGAPIDGPLVGVVYIQAGSERS